MAKRIWDKEKVTEAIAAFVKEHNRLPKPLEYTSENGLPGYGSAEKHLGMKLNLFYVYNYAEMRISENYDNHWLSKEEVEILLDRYITEHGHIPIESDFKRENALPLYQTAQKHIGKDLNSYLREKYPEYELHMPQQNITERGKAMIKVSVQHGIKSAEIELPVERSVLHSELWKIDIREKAENIKLNEEDIFTIRLSSDTDFGKSLIKLFSKDYSIDYMNACLYKLESARLSILEDMEGDILHEQYESPENLMEDLDNRISEMIKVTVDYYCPLEVKMDDDYCTDFIKVDNCYALSIEDTIRERLMEEQNEDLNDMSFYFDGNQTAKDKIISAVWDVKDVNGTLYGVIHTHLTDRFSHDEEKSWIDELIGQAADGFGEGFEHREFYTDDGTIYVSFWNGGDDYFMENENDFQMRIADSQNMGIQM